jgi:ferrous iron transport protein A
MTENSTPATQLEKGQSGTITGFTDNALAAKLTSMGVLPNTSLQLIREAPFGDTFYVKAGGSSLALRKEELATITVEPHALEIKQGKSR